MVDKINIDALFEQGKTEELIPLLEKAIEEEYEEVFEENSRRAFVPSSVGGT